MNSEIGRRDFLKTVGKGVVAGSAMLAGCGTFSEATKNSPFYVGDAEEEGFISGIFSRVLPGDKNPVRDYHSPLVAEGCRNYGLIGELDGELIDRPLLFACEGFDMRKGKNVSLRSDSYNLQTQFGKGRKFMVGQAMPGAKSVTMFLEFGNARAARDTCFLEPGENLAVIEYKLLRAGDYKVRTYVDKEFLGELSIRVEDY